MNEKAINAAKRRMMEAIRNDIRDTAGWTGRDQFAPPVMQAMETVPRHAFVEGMEPYYAYANRPAPIGHSQTISQPYMVALMTELLDLTPSDRVLEIGTGCGYQTAILAEIAAEVFSIEVIADLAAAARDRLDHLGYGKKVQVRHGDGFGGWPDEAPFDAIIVTAAPRRVPEQLLHQLRVGGRLVIPLGRPRDTQMLYRMIRRKDGGFDEARILPVAFVPMLPQKSDT
ncbi:MAG: protein-L-isoaspartate(D-aspartate) O-methyltransferase [Alphaproteobacteria bacterium]|nr:protein-L-isoaspartate(D-aspartate) O-methyltransferase [Alphaproteobacteria bacterium]